MKERYSFYLSPHQPAEVEVMEVEESEQFVDFYEDPRPYQGIKPEDGISLIFVDGVRRTEKLVYIKDEETGDNFDGAFVSLGAGALRLSHGRVNFLEESLVEKRIKRVLFVRGSLPLDKVLDFQTVCVDGEISVRVNKYLRDELEAKVALSVLKSFSEDLIVCDGVLSQKLKGTSCIGFVKSIRRLYFDKRYMDILYQLKPGERSPIVKVHYQQTQEEEEKVDKLTWYVKLSYQEGLHGIARVEAFPREDIKRIADISAYLLPLFASQPFQDRRAPQNLLPIGKLEMILRKYLGPYSLIRRQIESHLYA